MEETSNKSVISIGLIMVKGFDEGQNQQSVLVKYYNPNITSLSLLNRLMIYIFVSNSKSLALTQWSLISYQNSWAFF